MHGDVAFYLWHDERPHGIPTPMLPTSTFVNLAKCTGLLLTAGAAVSLTGCAGARLDKAIADQDYTTVGNICNNDKPIWASSRPRACDALKQRGKQLIESATCETLQKNADQASSEGSAIYSDSELYAQKLVSCGMWDDFWGNTRSTQGFNISEETRQAVAMTPEGAASFHAFIAKQTALPEPNDFAISVILQGFEKQSSDFGDDAATFVLKHPDGTNVFKIYEYAVGAKSPKSTEVTRSWLTAVNVNYREEGCWGAGTLPDASLKPTVQKNAERDQSQVVTFDEGVAVVNYPVRDRCRDALSKY